MQGNIGFWSAYLFSFCLDKFFGRNRLLLAAKSIFRFGDLKVRMLNLLNTF
jgi:hypothetical protein